MGDHYIGWQENGGGSCGLNEVIRSGGWVDRREMVVDSARCPRKGPQRAVKDRSAVKVMREDVGEGNRRRHIGARREIEVKLLTSQVRCAIYTVCVQICDHRHLFVFFFFLDFVFLFFENGHLI